MVDSGGQKAVVRVARHYTDSGSPEVQAVLYLRSLRALNRHLAQHPHDVVTRRVLLRKVALRKRMLRYLKRTNPQRYKQVLSQLSVKS